MSGYIGDIKYNGPERIVVAMDVGTTMTAVSFSYLYPDDYARVRMVNKWPGQPDSAGSSKASIPTILAYHQGKCGACGSEALEYVDNSQYDIVKWFKLHLHPPSMAISDSPPPYEDPNGASGFEVPPLPEDVLIHQVYSDFLHYLMKNTRISFEQSIPNGPAVWRRLKSTMILILTTPNGWDFTQQTVLRKAAISAGLVKEEEDTAYELLEFITEGEASVHYVLSYSQSKTWLDVGSVFAVVDAGGSTVDSTLYKCMSTTPRIILEEVCPSECIQAGGIFVDRAAEGLFKRKLSGSKFGDDDCIAEMVGAFENRTKRLYDGTMGNYVVDFGGTRDNDRPYGIIRGKLSLTSQDVSSTFQDVVQRIGESCLRLLGNHKAKYLLLVGGFGESQYLQRCLRERVGFEKISIVTAEEPVKKAAAEGALIWYIKRIVAARIARKTIGVERYDQFNPLDPQHLLRRGIAWTDHDGNLKVTGVYSPLVIKGTRMGNDFTNVVQFSRFYNSLEDQLGSFSCIISAWEGEYTPFWVRDTRGQHYPQLKHLCILTANLSGLKYSLQRKIGPKGEYYQVEFWVAVQFGGTQLHARLQWKERGILREGPVAILPNVAA
ncbi:hypothetical protein M408DRAFT_316623 [Serendipita vermifera MAFF 305830]|uniref:Actin-like ATPase domain-containing protein n=1 Tax=Serendipita vermifera MAFF 305830 TaxID=933852 RepID=A0A0C2X7A4_SERVB|nr:hypothetical protein M408DRAFT_316623 [Serendipita vermifera MAFF 305830]